MICLLIRQSFSVIAQPLWTQKDSNLPKCVKFLSFMCEILGFHSEQFEQLHNFKKSGINSNDLVNTLKLRKTIIDLANI